MTIQVDKNETVTLYYTARDTGLGDVVVSIYKRDGSTHLLSGIMTEIGTTKEYTYSFKAPPYEKIYRAVMDSGSKPLRTTETVVVTPSRKTGGVMRAGDTWTEDEKQTLVEAVRLLNERLGRMDDLFSSLTAEQRATEAKTEDKLKELKGDIGGVHENFTKMVTLWGSFSTQNLTAIEKQHGNLSKIEIELSELQKNDTNIAQKASEIDSAIGEKVDRLVDGTSRCLLNLTGRVDSYLASVKNNERLNDERLPLIITELEDVRSSIEELKETYYDTLSPEIIIKLKKLQMERTLNENEELS